jgi:hypothetical protein
MTRLKCPYCQRQGLVRSERIFKGRAAMTSYYCGGCTRAWEIVDEAVTRDSTAQPAPSSQARPA